MNTDNIAIVETPKEEILLEEPKCHKCHSHLTLTASTDKFDYYQCTQCGLTIEDCK